MKYPLSYLDEDRGSVCGLPALPSISYSSPHPLSVLGSSLSNESNKVSLFRSTLSALERIESERVWAPVRIAEITAQRDMALAHEETRQVTMNAMANIHATAIQCSMAPSSACNGVDIETTRSEGGFFSRKTRVTTRIRRY